MEARRPPDGIVLAGVAALAGAPLALHPGWGVAGLVGVGWALRRRVAISWWVGLLAIALGQAARVAVQLEAASHHADVAARVLGGVRTCELSVVVVSSPVVRRSVGQAPGRARLDAEVLSGCDLPGTRVRLYGMPERAGRGDVWGVSARLGPVRRFEQLELPDPRIGLVLRDYAVSGGVARATRKAVGRGLSAHVDRARGRVRARIEATYPPGAAPMGRALVLGENDLDSRDQRSFRDSGLSHLLAVSGSHLVIAVVALAQALRALLVRLPWLAERVEVGRLVALFTIAASWLYADFAGGGGSAYRAAFMLSAASAARASGRRAPAERSFGWSMLAGGLWQPLSAVDVSFALSLAATGGLLASRDLVGRLHRRMRPGASRWLMVTALATMAATVACAPVLLMLGPQVPVLGIAANAVAGPIGEVVALPLSLLHTLCQAVPSVERGMGAVAGGALLAVRAIAHGAATSPWATLSLPPPTEGQVVVLMVAGARAFVSPRRLRIALVATLALLGLEARARVPPHDGLHITVLDVGQGDALLVDLPDGRLMVVDGGGLVGSPIDLSDRVLGPVLRRRRRRRIDIAVLTHAHPDHYGGLVGLLAAWPVGELWDASRPRPGSPWHRTRARLRARGTVVRTAASLCRGERRFGPARVEVLNPCPRRDGWRHENDNSLVLRVVLGRHAALLAGDAEAEAERAMLEASRPLAASFLKVGHHGSRTSTSSGWLEAVRPRLAAMSRGIRNRFGHPHGATLEHLDAAGIVTVDTARDGAIYWETDGEVCTWHTARGARGPPWWGVP